MLQRSRRGCAGGPPKGAAGGGSGGSGCGGQGGEGASRPSVNGCVGVIFYEQ